MSNNKKQDLKHVCHLHKLITNDEGTINLPLQAAVTTMTGQDILSLLGAFKALYFEETWYQKVKMFLDIKQDMDICEIIVHLDMFNKIAAILEVEGYLGKHGLVKQDECLFDDDVILKPVHGKFEDVGKTIEFIAQGFQFWESDKLKLVLKYDNEVLSFFVHQKDKDSSSKMVKKFHKLVENKSLLKNKVIKLDGSIIKMEHKYTWDDVIVPDSIRETIMDNVQNFFKQLHIYKKNNVACKRGIILHGPPGTGKTLIGKVLASQVKSTFLWVTSQDILNQDVRSVFTMARRLSPTIVFLEDMDFYAARRGENAAKHILGELLAQLDGFEENHGIIVIGTTNDYEVIDSAISDRPNRFDKVVEIEIPSTKMRERMLKHKFQKHNCKDMNFQELAVLTKDFSGSHIEELVTLSVIEAVKSQSLDSKKKVIILPEHVKQAVKGVNTTRSSASMGLDIDDDDEEEEAYSSSTSVEVL